MVELSIDKSVSTVSFYIRECFRITKLMILHLLLVWLVIGYMMAGGYIFHRIEGDAEQQRIVKSRITRNETLQNLRNSKATFLSSEKTPEDLWTLLNKVITHANDNDINVTDIFSNSSEKCTQAFQWVKGHEQDWNYRHSILFAFTVITTIGYGNIAPTTFTGRIFCMVYALIGIPLTMLALADLGKYVVEFAQFVARQCRTLLCWTFCREYWKENKLWVQSTNGGLPLVIGVIGFMVAGSFLVPLWETTITDFWSGVYFNFVTLTTIGFGDIVPSTLEYLPLSLFYISIGLSLTAMCIEIIGSIFKKWHNIGHRVNQAQYVEIWFGGKTLSVQELLETVGMEVGVPPMLLRKLDLDEIVQNAINQKEEMYTTNPNRRKSRGPASMVDNKSLISQENLYSTKSKAALLKPEDFLANLRENANVGVRTEDEQVRRSIDSLPGKETFIG